MKPVELVRTLRRDAAFDPEALDRGRQRLMAQIATEGAPKPRPTFVPQLPYEDVAAAIEFLERAFGFREERGSRVEDAKTGRVAHAMLAFGEGLVGLGGQGGHGAQTPKSVGGVESQYVSVYVPDVDAHFERARAAGARIANGLRDQFWGDRTYEAIDPEGHRWRFHQRVREVPQSEWRWSEG